MVDGNHVGLTSLSPQEIINERKALKKRRRLAMALVVPLLLFITFSFVAPISSMLYRSVYDPVVADLIPATLAELKEWDGQSLPAQSTLAAMFLDLRHLSQERKVGGLASAVNRNFAGANSIINSSARRLRSLSDSDLGQKAAAQYLLESNEQWSEPKFWQAIKDAGRSYSEQHFLTALDLERTTDAGIQMRKSVKIYVQLYLKTLFMSITITLSCFLLGYPLAYFLAHLSNRTANILLIFVLLPFWTSLLVRTTSWIAILQTNGVLNSLLMYFGITGQPLEMLYTRFATIISMTHILLPFMILPLYSIMRTIDESYVRAALSMGSKPMGAFLKIYFPQTLPGVSAGALLVFIISVGYYITPALVGGTDGQMISNIIAFHMQESGNWSLAAALGALLLLLILSLYWLYDRTVGASNIRLG